MSRKTFLYILLIVLVVVLSLLSICVGSGEIKAADVIRIISEHDNESVMGKIVFGIRLPRVLTAMFLGGALALAGYMLQTFFSNPIAGPFVLGISSGAKLVVALLMVSSMELGFAINSFEMIVAAFIGALVATGLVLLVSVKVKHMSVLIVCGVMIGYICSAATELIITFADDSNIVNLHNWSMGSFSATEWKDLKVIIPIVLLGFVVAFVMSKRIEGYSYGEDYAQSLGINVKGFRVLLILLSSILAATVTAFAGPISFVGIAVPHIVRIMYKTVKPIVIIPAIILMGMVFCIFSDLLARLLFAPVEISISTITAILGAPVVISMLLKKQKG